MDPIGFLALQAILDEAYARNATVSGHEPAFYLCLRHYEEQIARHMNSIANTTDDEKARQVDALHAVLDKYATTLRHLEDMLSRMPAGQYAAATQAGRGDANRLLGQRRYVRSEGSFSPWNDRLRRYLEKALPPSFAALARLAPAYSLTETLIRYVLASAGGTTLLVPMILMSFYTSRAACLTITSLWVLGFGGFMAVFTAASKDALIASTAAYAAVLVVFVGNALTRS